MQHCFAAATLSMKDQAYYSEKVALYGVDKFELRESDCVRDINLWPRVNAADISEFLALRTSGWVREPWVKEVSSDSMFLKIKTCMAGNGEACSHVAELFLYIKYSVRMWQERSCTDNDNSWLHRSSLAFLAS
ncbi:hypothetical protein HPB52_012141 [Rhipicephalus sanguineus]|uniref:Uncharacterized protein n=1 Tax=Rhipicephalus sanguineus TaxID=34632 RepID=A0A9D4T9P9_RHISA|nr:hypothetical protein HPB52_012141 [Rhipicephalus sanguineus]